VALKESTCTVEKLTRIFWVGLAYLNFVLSHYVRVGVEEKLTPLLRLRYHNSTWTCRSRLGASGGNWAGFREFSEALIPTTCNKFAYRWSIRNPAIDSSDTRTPTQGQVEDDVRYQDL
jgi:hypothetical protein